MFDQFQNALTNPMPVPVNRNVYLLLAVVVAYYGYVAWNTGTDKTKAAIYLAVAAYMLYYIME